MSLSSGGGDQDGGMEFTAKGVGGVGGKRVAAIRWGAREGGGRRVTAIWRGGVGK